MGIYTIFCAFILCPLKLIQRRDTKSKSTN